MVEFFGKLTKEYKYTFDRIKQIFLSDNDEDFYSYINKFDRQVDWRSDAEISSVYFKQLDEERAKKYAKLDKLALNRADDAKYNW